MSKTKTGRAVYDFVWTIVDPGKRPADGRLFGAMNSVESLSSVVLQALVADLRERRPTFKNKFGSRQESASEGLVMLLDMIEDPDAEDDYHPITELFYHRSSGVVYCSNCEKTVSEQTDLEVQFNLFHYDLAKKTPETPSEFAEIVRTYISRHEDYRCEQCKKISFGYRQYRLKMVPEIIVCLFNLYDHTMRKSRYFPGRVPIPSSGGGQLVYRQIGQVEHSGSLHGGHYVARALRGDGNVYQFNDTSVTSSQFIPNSNVYIVMYHIEKIE